MSHSDEEQLVMAGDDSVVPCLDMSESSQNPPTDSTCPNPPTDLTCQNPSTDSTCQNPPTDSTYQNPLTDSTYQNPAILQQCIENAPITLSLPERKRTHQNAVEPTCCKRICIQSDLEDGEEAHRNDCIENGNLTDGENIEQSNEEVDESEDNEIEYTILNNMCDSSYAESIPLQQPSCDDNSDVDFSSIGLLMLVNIFDDALASVALDGAADEDDFDEEYDDEDTSDILFKDPEN